MRSICESGIVRGLRYSLSMDQIARCTLEPQPENIRAQRDADGFGEDVHKSCLGEARDFGESLE